MIISMGTIFSSLLSERLVKRLGTGCVTAASVCLTAIALLGFSYGTRFGVFCFWAIPLGLGAGSVDAALNNFVALHYRARHMNWLHCFWGIGATAGPVILSFWLAQGESWAMGYRTVGTLQLMLSAVLVFILPLWRRVEGKEADADAIQKKGPLAEGTQKKEEFSDQTEATGKTKAGRPENHEISGTLRSLLSLPGVKPVLVAFFCYHAVEMTIGLWSSSYLVLCKGISAAMAASLLSLYYVGITAGRLFAGFLAEAWEERRLIRAGLIILILGMALVVAGLKENSLRAAFLLMGAGCAPIYPSLLHETPKNFGSRHCQAIMGIQMSAAYAGATCMPPVFGVLGSVFGYQLFPVYVAVLLCLTICMVEKVNRSTGAFSQIK